MQEIRFDDIDSLTAAVSDDYGDFGTEVEVTQEDIDAFAELTSTSSARHGRAPSVAPSSTASLLSLSCRKLRRARPSRSSATPSA